MKIRLWFVEETEKARHYCKLPPERHPGPEDYIWLPRSVCLHTSKRPNGEHIVDVEDWFAEQKDL